MATESTCRVSYVFYLVEKKKKKKKKRLADVRRLPLARCINLLLLDQVDYNK